MMEEKWERVGEETNLQHMHFKKKQNKKEKWAPRAYLFSFPMWLKMTMVAFNLPSKLSQMVAFNLPSKLSQMAAFNLTSISSRTNKNPLKSQNPLSKEMDEMRNRMREMGVKECLVGLVNPRLQKP
jgi:hypothetical protein